MVIDELCALPVVSTDPELVRRAIETSRRFEIAVWDALIIEAARVSGCRRVVSEDLQSGQDFAGVVVESPFES
jgi:predicted nucleic acid-binding protein